MKKFNFNRNVEYFIVSLHYFPLFQFKMHWFVLKKPQPFSSLVDPVLGWVLKQVNLM